MPWTSDEHYEWLPGGFFLLHQWDANAGTREFKGTEIIGHDEANGGYFTHGSSTTPASIPNTPQPLTVLPGNSSNHRHERPSPCGTMATRSSTCGNGCKTASGCRSASEPRRAGERRTGTTRTRVLPPQRFISSTLPSPGRQSRSRLRVASRCHPRGSGRAERSRWLLRAAGW